MPKQSFKTTLLLIANILSYQDNAMLLHKQLSRSTIDWDDVVKVASKHLVLPALYCRLKEKSLLNLLPEELNDYLERLTEINRNRNRTLLKEAQDISSLLNSHDIDHVFVKGMAMIAGSYYKDIGERMIGDIDILIKTEQLQQAFDLLTNRGYEDFMEFNYEPKNFRHLARQISKHKMGAVELHDQLLVHKYNHLIQKEPLMASKEIKENIAIPSKSDLLWILILTHQINDNATFLGFLKLRTVYDCLVLKLDQVENLPQNISNQKEVSIFMAKSSVLFPELAREQSSIRTYFYKKRFLISIKHHQLTSVTYHILSAFLGLKERLGLLLFNKSYRQHVIKNKVFK